VLASGMVDHILDQILAGKAVGTHFLPATRGGQS
jgi:hypothetical protein